MIQCVFSFPIGQDDETEYLLGSLVVVGTLTFLIVLCSFMVRDAFKKKNSIWRDIVPTRGGEGEINFKMSLLKIPFY